MASDGTRFIFTAGRTPAETFAVVGFTLKQSLSSLFRLDITVACNDPAIGFKQVLDEMATLTIWQGLITDKPVLDKNGLEIKNKKGEVKYEKKFEVSPDEWRNLKELRKQRLITGVTPYPRKATYAVQKWLDLRFKPEYAIMAAVDYGVANLASLENAGYNIDGLNDAEKAKLIYLTHHLGLGDAMLFIKNKISEDKASHLLKAQVGVRSALNMRMLMGSYVQAHRKWLIKYINNNIKLEGYFCVELTKPPKLEDVDLTDVLAKI